MADRFRPRFHAESAADAASPKACRSWFGARAVAIKGDVQLEHLLKHGWV
jgi:hypothetical protein